MDKIKITGEFRLNVFRIINGKKYLIKSIKDKNLVVTDGKDMLSSLLCNDVSADHSHITQIGFGTDNTPPVISDDNLDNLLIKGIDNCVVAQDAVEIDFNWTLGQTEGNGMTIAEYGLFSAGSSLFSRIIQPVIHKESDIIFTGEWKIIFT